MRTGALSPGAKRPGREADHSAPPNAEIKKTWVLYTHSPIRLHGVVLNYLSAGITSPVTVSFYIPPSHSKSFCRSTNVQSTKLHSVVRETESLARVCGGKCHPSPQEMKQFLSVISRYPVTMIILVPKIRAIHMPPLPQERQNGSNDFD
jgi:hypothetical protein